MSEDFFLGGAGGIPIVSKLNFETFNQMYQVTLWPLLFPPGWVSRWAFLLRNWLLSFSRDT